MLSVTFEDDRDIRKNPHDKTRCKISYKYKQTCFGFVFLILVKLRLNFSIPACFFLQNGKMTQGNEGPNCLKWVESWARIKWWLYLLDFLALSKIVVDCDAFSLCFNYFAVEWGLILIPFPYINWIGFVAASMFQLVYCNLGSINRSLV